MPELDVASSERRARVLEITSYPPPHAGWGVRVSFVRKHLEAAGHECQVLNIGRSRRVKGRDFLDVQSGADYLRKVWAHARAGYLVHAHLNGDSPKGLVLALVAMLTGAVAGRGSILTFHAGPRQRFFPKSQNRVLAPAFRLAFAMPQRIICNSPAVKASILEYGVPSERVMPIPAFSRQYLDYRAVDLEGDLQRFLVRHRPVMVSYVFLRPEFTVECLMEATRLATSRLPNMGLVLAGGDSKTPTMTELVRAKGLEGRIFQAGDLGHDEFMTLLSRVDMYVRTPEKDGVCSSVLEALSLRVPVVASDNGTRPESVVTFRTGDASELSGKIVSVGSVPDRAKGAVAVPRVEDTVGLEARLLVDTFQNGGRRSLAPLDTGDGQRRTGRKPAPDGGTIEGSSREGGR